MVLGFIADRFHWRSRHPSLWVEGKPEKSFWTGQPKFRKTGPKQLSHFAAKTAAFSNRMQEMRIRPDALDARSEQLLFPSSLPPLRGTLTS